MKEEDPYLNYEELLIWLVVNLTLCILIWVFVEEKDSYLNYEELENAIYEKGAYPANAKPSSNIEG